MKEFIKEELYKLGFNENLYMLYYKFHGLYYCFNPTYSNNPIKGYTNMNNQYGHWSTYNTKYKYFL